MQAFLDIWLGFILLLDKIQELLQYSDCGTVSLASFIRGTQPAPSPLELGRSVPVNSDRNNELLTPVPAIRISAGAIAATAERIGGDAVELVDAAKGKTEESACVQVFIIRGR